MSTPPDRGGNPARQPELSYMQPELSYDVSRGIFVPGAYHSSNDGLGVHWSGNKRIAEEMGTHSWHDHATKGMWTHPNDRIVVHNAEVPMSSVETDIEVLKKNKVFSPDNLNNNSEEEVPVKKGATVRLKSSSSTKTSNYSGYRTRKRTYNPPREMKA